MKVTKAQLKQIINEELRATLNEGFLDRFKKKQSTGPAKEPESEEEECKRLQQRYDELMTKEHYGSRSRMEDEFVDRMIESWREYYPCMRKYIEQDEDRRRQAGEYGDPDDPKYR